VSIATSMPAMSMSGPTVRAISKGNGTYVAALNLNFATRWSFAAIAQAGGRTARRVVQQDVKWPLESQCRRGDPNDTTVDDHLCVNARYSGPCTKRHAHEWDGGL